MSQPKVSVIIPVYNGASYLREAIQSVLDQTYQEFEIIVVNDASTDHTSEVIKQFADSRLKYISHEQNRGLPATRNTAIRASSGQFISLLDQDDIFHPEKVEAHVNFLEKNPQIGATYNSRIEIDPSGNSLAIWRPPLVVGHSDFVLGFPFAPSDMTVRRDWIFQVGLFDEYYVFGGEDLDLTCRLALAGCQFAGVDRLLNYRRYYPGRILRNPAGGLDGALHALEKTFTDPLCSPQVLALRNTALAITYQIWAYEAFIKNETALGQELIRKAIQLDSSILDNEAKNLLQFLIFRSNQDGSDHEPFLRQVFAQLASAELAWLAPSCDWAIGQGYLVRGIRGIIWGRPDQGSEYLNKAAELGVRLDEPFLRSLADQLINYETEFGTEAAQKVLQELGYQLEKVGTQADIRWLQGCYSINHAFRDYQMGQYLRVPAGIWRAISNDPAYLTNRGVISILARSLIGAIQKPVVRHPA
jgi:glycosyltransferase involved in cell wall biosynthesis